MPCEHYKDALIEVAANDAALRGELREHLAGCVSCRAAFQQEQSLFAGIDSGLRAAANAEVPPALLPRVRSRLDEAATPRLGWMRLLVFASAGVALAFVAFLLARPRHAAPREEAQQGPASAPALAAPTARANPERISSEGTQIAAVRLTHSRASRSSTNAPSRASSNLEVLVPPGTEAAFLRSLPRLLNDLKASQQWREQGKALEIKPLAIEEISSAPLSPDEGDSGSHGGIGQFRSVPLPAGFLRAEQCGADQNLCQRSLAARANRSSSHLEGKA